MKYKTLCAIVRFIMNIITDVEVVGLEKLPQGNVLIAANHLGRLDTAVLLYILDREDIIMAVAEKYKKPSALWRDRAHSKCHLAQPF